MVNENEKVSHSASICWHNGYQYLAMYRCKNEGWTQQVVLYERENLGDRWEEIERLEYGTGNPIIFSFGGTLWLAYTKFRDEMEGETNVPMMWANTDMYVKSIVFVGDDSQLLDQKFHFSYTACRCQPLIAKVNMDSTASTPTCFLPCYDESLAMGIIFFLYQPDGLNDEYVMRRHSVFGGGQYPLIQPTLGLSEKGMFALSRNFEKGYIEKNPRKCIASVLKKNKWDICYSKYPNFNESCLLFSTKKYNYVIYGAALQRKELRIHRSDQAIDKAVKLNETTKGAYPNYCINPDGTITIVFTAYNGRLSDKTDICVLTIDEDLNVLKRKYFNNSLAIAEQ